MIFSRTLPMRLSMRRHAYTSPVGSAVITSDDVFDYMLNLRELNTHIDQEREKLFQEHTQARHTVFQLRNLDDYEELKKRLAELEEK